jgi:hypothetical protein
MNIKRYLIPLLLFLPILSFSQSRAIRNLDDNFPKVDIQYFYESVIRAAGNVAMGKDGVELTRGIRKVIRAEVKHVEGTENAVEDFKKWLHEDDYETYIEVTNRGNLAGMASYFMDLLGQKTEESEPANEKELENVIKEMAVYAIDDGNTISSLCILMIGDKSTQVYEVHGKLELDSVPEIITRVQKFMEVLE